MKYGLYGIADLRAQYKQMARYFQACSIQKRCFFVLAYAAYGVIAFFATRLVIQAVVG